MKRMTFVLVGNLCCLAACNLTAFTKSSNAGGGGGGGGHGSFDYNRDCFANQGQGGSIDFERDPIVFWPCFENATPKGTAQETQFAKNSDQVNEALGTTVLTCTIDHKGFDEFFKAEAAKKVKDRNDAFTPLECAHVLGLFMGNNALSAPITGTIMRHPKIKAEFFAKVSKLNCAYDEKDDGLVTLDGKTLTFVVGPKSQGNGSIETSIRRLFPEYNKVWESEH
jgi:hypothetical protein